MTDDSIEGRTRSLCASTWRKSSFSAGGECVTVAEVGHEIALRNSNRPDAGTLFLGRNGLAVWIAGVKAGEFDNHAA